MQQTQAVVTIQIVGWNSAKTLPAALDVLAKIPESLAVIRYIDNNSSDASVALVQSMLPRADVIVLDKNRGFTGAHNIGLLRCQTPLVFTHDPDLILNLPGWLELLHIIQQHPQIGALQGKLWRFQTSLKKETIDSAGIILTQAGNGRERGANEMDKGQYDTAEDVAATTGAASFYRMEAMRDVAFKSEFFDEDFFAYKDDVDLGWRLRRKGWEVKYLPIWSGRHARSLGRRGRFNWGFNPVDIGKRLRNRRTRYSLRNWIWMLVKNLSGLELITRAPFILTRGLVFLGITAIYWPLIQAWLEAAVGLPKMLQKRRV